MNEKKRSAFPGYLWSPGSSPQDNPLQIVVAVVVIGVLVGCVALAVVVS